MYNWNHLLYVQGKTTSYENTITMTLIQLEISTDPATQEKGFECFTAAEHHKKH